eukprot:TRINITY_DN4686_c0_g1_i4.p1 TRINITY_DN4686_c0_g1~~TRINITY_DN4686_c0_g1_i4.p1  ORF type:complete len:278 (-),score=40.42 TRINITY_DN4686_c0_g1_i4:490-1278(-)
MASKPKTFKMRGKYPPGGPAIVRQELERLGYKWVPPNTPNELVDVIWTMRLEIPEQRQLLEHQKTNFLPSMQEVALKHMLHKNIVAAAKLNAQKEYDFWPKGYNLPEEWEDFVQMYKDHGDQEIPYIIKPSRQAMGNGIICITHASQLDKDSEYVQTKTPVAQQYIMDPLLIDGYKITFRIYVCITSVDPLRIYVFPNGLTRICSEKFTSTLDSFKNSFIHLTNYDINKFNKQAFESNISKDIKQEGLRCNRERTRINCGMK